MITLLYDATCTDTILYDIYAYVQHLHVCPLSILIILYIRLLYTIFYIYSMFPAILANIPIYIRNTFEPAHPGTRIFRSPAKGQVVRENCVCGFSTVDNIGNIDYMLVYNMCHVMLVYLF